MDAMLLRLGLDLGCMAETEEPPSEWTVGYETGQYVQMSTNEMTKRVEPSAELQQTLVSLFG